MKDIIFLPGLGCDSRLFTHQIQTLSHHYTARVIVCDACDAMADHVQYVLRQTSEEFILVGHSFGGWIAQWIAIQAPQRVSKLILMGAGTGELTPTLLPLFQTMLARFERGEALQFFEEIRPVSIYETRKNDTELLDLIRGMQTDFPQKGLINQVRTDLEGKDTFPELQKIQCPTLLIHGAQDCFYAREMGLLKTTIPQNQYVEIDHCGHMIPLERPEAVSALMSLWLA